MNKLLRLFKLRGEVPQKEALFISTLGVVLIITFWQIVSLSGLVATYMLPSPMTVLSAVIELFFKDTLISDIIYSVKINLMGYFEAVAIALPLGMAIGIFPLFREMFKKPIDVIRFLPITALTGIFIYWFGIGDNMKVQFLAFGIIVYLVPIVINRVNEVSETHVQMLKTLGANNWQTIKTIFIPAVISSIFDDIRVLVAISWTYIIIVEMMNRTEGVGALIYTCIRQSRLDKVFAILVVIIIIGIIQDVLFKYIDKFFSPHKYESVKKG